MREALRRLYRRAAEDRGFVRQVPAALARWKKEP
jgi:hypothetical protein